MWPRLLRLIRNGLNLYSFYANPTRFLTSLLCVILLPYLAYLFWGTLIIMAIIISGIYLIYKTITAANNHNSTIL